MNSIEIRKKFLKFFEKNGHTVVPSSSLIPGDDPTLLFTNAGMNQFKDAFLGKEKRSYVRATSVQKCVRAGGKHNDLEEVGFSERHLTFFEMLGNFSFGDYFKKEAIHYAWDFLTKEMGFDGEKLYPTVFETDDEAFDIWYKEIGIPKERITRLGEADNFWRMGDTGPCGPCSEILYDRGEKYSCNKPSCKPGCDCARYNEVWNLVFMQYNQQASGELKPLMQTGVDTGMGFERLCMLSQGAETIYDIDYMLGIIKRIEKLSGKKYDGRNEKEAVPFRVLTDHLRSSCLIMADGGTPSNEGRGYVLRKIIRRATLFAKKLSKKEDLFPRLAQMFIDDFQEIFPELKKGETLIINLLTSEIDRFSTSIESGEAILEKYIAENAKAGKTELTGIQAFKLYDTYGFPLELTTAIARERKLSVDIKGFEENMQKQQEQSGKKDLTQEEILNIPENIKTKFTGDEELETTSKIIFAKQEDGHVWIVTEQSPFYVESGGQVSDSGFVSINDQSHPVVALQKSDGAIAVKVLLKDSPSKIKVNDIAHCVVNAQDRTNTVRNHSATHLLQAALRQVLGGDIKQAGSLVEPNYLRFDFNYHQAMTQTEIDQTEKLVNQKIQETIEIKIYTTTLDKAKESGIIAFFGEKYNPECVRVVEVPGFSAELCGGTHAKNTGVIGAFKIISESSLSTGVRRIVALTGPKATEMFQQSFNITKALSEQFKTKPEGILEAVQRESKNYNNALKEIKKLKKQLLKNEIPTWQSQVALVGKIPFLYLEVEDLDNDDLKNICGKIEKKAPGFYFIINKNTKAPSRIGFLAYLSKDFSNQVNFKELGGFLKDKLALRGGGSNTLMQGGGEMQTGIKEAVSSWLKSL